MALLIGLRRIQGLLIALAIEVGDNRGLGKLLLTGKHALRHADTIAPERPLRNRVAGEPLLLLRVLVIELRLRGVHHVLDIGVQIVLDLSCADGRCAGSGVIRSFADIWRCKPRARIDAGNAQILLGVERGDKFARIGLIRGLCDRLRPRQNVAIECSGLRVSARRGRLRAGALRIAFAQFPISHSGTLCCLDHGACRSVNKIASHRVPKLAPIQLHLGFGALIRHHADDQGYS